MTSSSHLAAFFEPLSDFFGRPGPRRPLDGVAFTAFDADAGNRVTDREASVGVVNATAEEGEADTGSLDGVTAFARSIRSSAALSLSPPAAAVAGGGAEAAAGASADAAETLAAVEEVIGGGLACRSVFRSVS